MNTHTEQNTQEQQAPRRRRMLVVAAIVGSVLLFAGGLAAGYMLLPRWLHTVHEHQSSTMYTCPMHPQVVQEGPGTCPLCFMDLVPVGHNSEQSTGSGHSDMLHITPRSRVVAGVRTVVVDSAVHSESIGAAGVVEYIEEARSVVSARYSGRIEKMLVRATGQIVRKGQPIAEVYSPALTAAQQEYLLAVEAQRARADRSALLAASRRKLMLLGMTDAQIAAIEKRGEIAYTVEVFSPVSGVVVSRAATEGAYVNEGSPLVEIIDMTSVWVVAHVYESDIPRLRIGQIMEVTGAALGSTVLRGKVDYMYPTVDPQTRTVKVRGVFAARGVLKPGMYVSASLAVPAVRSLYVPVNAVLRTGKRDIVYVEVKKNMFEPREVVLGTRADGYYQVIGGALRAGERIAAEGGYLLDSERQLSSFGNAHAGHTAGGGQ